MMDFLEKLYENADKMCNHNTTEKNDDAENDLLANLFS